MLGSLLPNLTFSHGRKFRSHEQRQDGLLRELLENAPLMTAFFDPSGRLQFVNRVWEETLGWSSQESLGRDVFTDLYPDEKYRTGVQEFISRAEKAWSDFRTCTKDGRVLQTKWINIRLQDGSIVGFGRDVTEEKKKEALREKLFRYSIDLKSVQSLSGFFQELNPAWEKTLGWTEEELLGRAWIDFVHPDDRETSRDKLHELRQGHPVIGFENRYLCRDGSWRKITWNASVLLEEHLILSVGRDVTEQRRIEDLHQNLHKRSTDLFAVIDVPNRRFREMNPSWVRILGWTPEELHAQDWHDLIHPDDHAAAEEAWRDLVKGRSNVQAEIRCLCKNGQFRTLDCNASVLSSEGLAFFGARDVTQRRALKRQAMEADRMTSLARMAGGVAHDFKNLLTVVMARAQLSQLDLPEEDPMFASLAEINSAAAKAAQLADRLLIFSKPQQGTPKNINLNDLIPGMQKLLEPVLTESISVTLDLAADLPEVLVDESQLEQVILNLAVNARDAMPDGGNLTIATRRALTTNPNAPVSYVELEIRDSGTGIPEHVRERIFEPFFTTKESKGTGLGLPTVYQIVRASGGLVTFESEEGQGTTFHVFLPQAQEGAKDNQRDENTDLTGGSETILVVDDDLGVLTVVSRMAQCWGYQVLVAHGPKEAVRLASEHAGPIELLLSDVVMPEMPGPKLAYALRELRPEMKVLFMTGHAEEAMTTGLPGLPIVNLLQKPFGRKALATRIREVLDGSGS